MNISMCSDSKKILTPENKNQKTCENIDFAKDYIHPDNIHPKKIQ